MRRLTCLSHVLLLLGWACLLPTLGIQILLQARAKTPCLLTSVRLAQPFATFPGYIHFSLSDSKSKLSYWPFVIRKQQQHCLCHTLHAYISWLPLQLSSSSCFWACSTHQQGKNMEDLKNCRKKKAHSLKIKLQTRTTSTGLWDPFFFCQTLYIC